MTEHTRFVGVDISKTHLEVHVHPGGERLRLANTPAGAAALVARFPGAAFACEASGGHERALLCAAVEAGAPAWRLHPADVRAFARLQGVRAKTDPIDARMIAHACAAAAGTRAPAVSMMAAVRRSAAWGEEGVVDADAVIPLEGATSVVPAGVDARRPRGLADGTVTVSRRSGSGGVPYAGSPPKCAQNSSLG